MNDTIKPVFFVNEGERIAGSLHLPAGRARCSGVVMVHGFAGQRCGARFILVELSRRLAQAGIASLRFDCRGGGESGGTFEATTTTTQLSDATAAMRELASLRRVDRSRVGVVGVSLGGLVAALLAGSQQEIKSAVLLSPVARADEMAQSMLTTAMRETLSNEGRIDVGGLYLGKGFFEDINGLDGPSRLAESSAAVLVINGGEDETVPTAHAEQYFLKASARKLRAERLIIPGADHTYGAVAWREAALSAAVEFFKGTLGEPRCS